MSHRYMGPLSKIRNTRPAALESQRLCDGMRCHVTGSSCSFTVLNTPTNCFEMTANEANTGALPDNSVTRTTPATVSGILFGHRTFNL